MTHLSTPAQSAPESDAQGPMAKGMPCVNHGVLPRCFVRITLPSTARVCLRQRGCSDERARTHIVGRGESGLVRVEGF